MAVPFKYNWKSLFVRRVSNAMTAGGIALVVAVFVVAMAMVAGLDSTIKDTSSPDTMIILSKGVDSELTSRITLDQLDALKFLPSIKRDGTGNPLVSPELAEQIFMSGAGNSLDNLPIRGALPENLKVHDKIRIVSGRMRSSPV